MGIFTMDVSQENPIDNVTLTVARNLQDQHDWTSVEILKTPGQPRPLIRALPPKLLYLHPDDQIATLAHEQQTGEKIQHDAEYEIVLPVRLAEKWSLSSLAAIFDSMELTGARGKRIVLATLHDDSTVVYYLMHEGMVKPRQN